MPDDVDCNEQALLLRDQGRSFAALVPQQGTFAPDRQSTT